MRKTLRYRTSARTEADVEEALASRIEALGVVLVDARIDRCPNGFDVTVGFEIPDPADPLLGRIERIVERGSYSTKVALSPCAPWPDQAWKPFDPKEMYVAENVRFDGPLRYGVVGLISDEYRICVGSNDDQPYEPEFVAAEQDLTDAVDRVIRYIRNGPEPLDSGD